MITQTYDEFEALCEVARKKIRSDILAHILATRNQRDIDMVPAILSTLGGALSASAQIIAELIRHHSIPRDYVEQEMMTAFRAALDTALSQEVTKQ